jgi:hypothetical protein
MKALAAVVFCVLPFAGSTAFADAKVIQPRSISRTGHPTGHHSKASSLAPRTRSKNRVYGAPIQRPILAKRTPHATSTLHPEQPKPNSH